MWKVEFYKNHYGCWIPNRASNSGGYVQVYLNKKHIMLHRFMYEKYFGKIPPGKIIMHTCDNPRCSNPAHLVCGTHKDNTQDSYQKGRFSVGEKHPSAKITEEIAREIKEWLAQGIYGIGELSAMMGVSYGIVSHIKYNLSWKHVEIT